MIITVEAGPGCGKSTTLEMIFTYLREGVIKYQMTPEQKDILNEVHEIRNKINPRKIIVLTAFNPLRDELKEKLKGGLVQNFNQAGSYFLHKKRHQHTLSRDKLRNIVCSELDVNYFSITKKEREEIKEATKLIDMMKQEMLSPSPETVRYLMIKYGFENPLDHDLAERVLKRCIDDDLNLDYTDQMWVTLPKLPKTPIYDLALIDENQDLSTLRTTLAIRLSKHQVFFGDPHQAINAFAGADCYAFHKMARASDCVLPLKLNFRNPPNIVKAANEGKPTANLVAHKTEEVPQQYHKFSRLPTELEKFIRCHDLNDSVSNHILLARTNAVLMKTGLHLLKYRIPCKLMRRGENSRITQPVRYYLNNLPFDINEARAIVNAEIASLNHNENTRFQNRDVVDCVHALLEDASSIEQIESILDKLDDETGYAFDLCTIHRAKGLERRHVWLLNPPLKSPYARTEEEIIQEDNVRHVGITRTSHYQHWVQFDE